jgi:hypothetical protein
MPLVGSPKPPQLNCEAAEWLMKPPCRRRDADRVANARAQQLTTTQMTTAARSAGRAGRTVTNQPVR